MTEAPTPPPLQTGDTPIQPKSYPPPARIDVVKAFIGDLARPFVLYMVGLSVVVVPLILAARVLDKNIELGAAAVFVGAIGATAGGLYWGKAWEVAKGKAADAEVAKANSTTT